MVSKVVTAGVLSLCLCSAAAGYEDDFHFGLTQWLALQAGLRPGEAQILANGAVSYDHSHFSAPSLVWHYACQLNNKDPTASKIVQKFHFPGDGPVPGPPQARAVDAGGPEAQRDSREQIEHPSQRPDTSLDKFGEGLHALQDSWSHQGVPDPPAPLICDTQLSWGHPRARGGWSRHDADLTYRYPEDAMKAAHMTYKEICEYAMVVLKRPCAKTFDAYAKDVEAFARARTKKDKREWFEAHGFKDDDLTFIDATSLPNERPGHRIRRRQRSNINPQALQNSEEVGFMLSFVKDWLTQSDLSSLVRERVVREHFEYQPGFAGEVTLNSEDIARLLLLWRSRDHGAVAEVLHEPQYFQKNAADAVQSTKELTGPFETLDDVLEPMDKEGAPMIVSRTEGRGGPGIAALVRFGHAPYDVVVVLATRREGRYQVNGLASVVAD